MRKICKDVNKTNEQSLCVLYEALEERYGLVLAQQIIDEIKKADNRDYLPDYVAAKSVSEAVEFIRPKAQKTLKSLKQAKSETSRLPDGVKSLYLKRAEQDFERLFGAYILAKATYNDFYTRIMTDIQKRRYVPRPDFTDVPRNPETAELRKAA